MATSKLAAKLHPSNFTAMSGKMAAIVAYLLGERWTEPSIGELIVTSDRIVMARDSGDIGANRIIGSSDDLWRNLSNLARAAELTKPQRAALERLVRERIVWPSRPFFVEVA